MHDSALDIDMVGDVFQTFVAVRSGRIDGAGGGMDGDIDRTRVEWMRTREEEDGRIASRMEGKVEMKASKPLPEAPS